MKSESSVIDAFAEPGAQGSIEWLMARVGYTSCSRFGDVLDKLKSGQPGMKRKNYVWEKAIERITEQPAGHYESAAMQWGAEHEDEARQQYEAATGVIVDQTGFIHHPTLAWTGGSCDGMVDDNGLIEIKNPYNSQNHLQCFLSGFPEDHKAQCQGLLWVMNRQWIDCVSYDCRMPDPLHLYIERQQRDEEYISALAAEVKVFNDEVAALVDHLHSIAAGKAKA